MEQVFLMSRIGERYPGQGDNERAVGEGLAASVRTISSAAPIMTLFGVCALTGGPSIRELGMGLRGRDRARRDPLADASSAPQPGLT